MKLYEITAHTYENACKLCTEYNVDTKYIEQSDNECAIPIFDNKDKDDDILYLYQFVFATNNDEILYETILGKDDNDAVDKFNAIKDKYNCKFVFNYHKLTSSRDIRCKIIDGKLVSI